MIGHSLGGNFLLKYFGENPDFPHTLNTIHLVAACIECGDFSTPENYDILRSLRNRVHIWQADDDSLVPPETARMIATELPDAITHFFGNEQ